MELNVSKAIKLHCMLDPRIVLTKKKKKIRRINGTESNLYFVRTSQSDKHNGRECANVYNRQIKERKREI